MHEKDDAISGKQIKDNKKAVKPEKSEKLHTCSFCGKTFQMPY